MSPPDWETGLEEIRGRLGERVTLGWALAFCGLAMVLAFLLGRAHPEEDYRLIAEDLSAARQDARAARNERTAAERESRALRARADLNKSAATALARRAEAAEREKTALAERVAFYQRLFGERNPDDGELAIQALEVTPDFLPNRHHLSAVLLRNGDSRKPFEGRYYFEAVERAGEKSEIVRIPAEGAELSFDFYLEIEERLELPANAEIENVRLVVTDADGRHVAESALIESAGGGGRGGNADGKNESADGEGGEDGGNSEGE